MLDERRLALVDADLAFLGERLQSDRPVGPLTTYRVGGPAARFVEVADPDELAAVAAALATRVRPVGDDVLVVGRGSNLLVADSGVAALVLVLGEGFTGIEVVPEAADGAVEVRAGAAVSLPVLARRTVAEALTGFEWAVGVPGSVGGAVRMNAGGHGSDMSASLVRVRVVDLSTGEDDVVAADDLHLDYRRSDLRPEQVVARADLRLRSGDRARGEAELAEIVRWRRENQPGGQNAGSVFTNPEGDSAGRLVESAGCRGLRHGTAAVSDKHANFIQADPGGSADDVLALMRHVHDTVLERTGVELHPETVLVGFGQGGDATPWPRGRR